MKKSRFISALTSVAMTAGLLVSVMPFGVSASELVSKPSTTALKLGAEQTSFTMEEVAAGNAKTTITMYADSFNDDEKITTIIGGFAASDDRITIGDIDLPDNMALTTVSKLGDDKAASPKRRFKQAAANNSNHNFVIAADATNPIVLENADRPIVTFDVEFASDMEAGTYTINFENGETPLEVQSGYEFRTQDEIDASGVASGTLISVYTDAVRANSKGVDIVLGGAPVTEETKPTGDTKKYDGNVKIWAENVVGEPGENVKVDIYADTDGEDIAAVELKPVWDTKAFELVGMKEGYGIDGLPTLNVKTGAYVIAQADEDKLPNDPSEPIVTLEFKPTSSAKEGTKYPISFEGTNGSSEVLAMKNKGKTVEDDVYFRVNLTDGSITLKATETEPTGLKYDGKIKIWADKVTAEPGETVEVNVYADTDGDDIAALEIKPVFDSKHLTLTGMKEGYGLDGMPTLNVKTGAYVIAQADEEKLANDPSEPIVTLTFKVSDDAAAGDVYEISFSGTNGSDDILAMKNKGKTTADDTYLEVTTENGSVTIKDAAPTTAATTPEPTIVTTISEVIVTSESVVTTISEVIVTTISEVIVTSESLVTTISEVIVTSESLVTTISEVIVTSESLVTTISVVTTIETVTSYVTVTEETTTVATTEPPVTTTQVQISVNVPSKADVEGDPLYWYHADNEGFYRDGIKITLTVNGEDVTDKATVEFNQTPAEVYDGENFDYEVEFKVTYGEYVETGMLPVKIGVRGDADMSGGTEENIGLNDAIRIANSMLPTGQKFEPNSFAAFLADDDEDGSIGLNDAIFIAQHMLPSYKGSWANILPNYANLIKS